MFYKICILSFTNIIHKTSRSSNYNLNIKNRQVYLFKYKFKRDNCIYL